MAIIAANAYCIDGRYCGLSAICLGDSGSRLGEYLMWVRVAVIQQVADDFRMEVLFDNSVAGTGFLIDPRDFRVDTELL